VDAALSAGNLSFAFSLVKQANPTRWRDIVAGFTVGEEFSYIEARMSLAALTLGDQDPCSNLHQAITGFFSVW